jgi:hypothetical protein
MTLGNMRANGVRSIDVSCWQCHHRAILSADPWPDDVPVPGIWAAHSVTRCGGQIVGACDSGATIERDAMAKKTFAEPKSWTRKITDDSGVIGTIRVRPSTVLWKPKGAKPPMPWMGINMKRIAAFIMKKGDPFAK